jgi:hypothetical protein
MRIASLCVTTVCSLIPAVTQAQQMDINNKTIIVNNGGVIEHIYIAPSGRIYFNSSNHPGIGLEYEIGKTRHFARREEWGLLKGQTCQHETSATVSGQVLTLRLVSASCNGQTEHVPGSGLEIEIKGDTCTARYAPNAPCNVVEGRRLD